MRALADAENLRERTRREKEQAQHLAIKSFATDLLSVTDILEIALVVSKRYGLQIKAGDADNAKVFASLRALAGHIVTHRTA